MDELGWFRQAIVRAYPNPDRIGCPAPEALDGMARRTIPMDASAQDHIFHCSPCFSTYLGIRIQIRRRRLIRTTGMWAAAAVLIIALTYSGYRVLGSATPRQFNVGFNMKEHPVFRGVHQAATHPSPFILPRGTVHVSLTLPLASEPGFYQVEISRDGQTEPVMSTSGKAALRSDGSTLLEIDMNSAKLRPGEYALGIRTDNSDWSYSSLVVP